MSRTRRAPARGWVADSLRAMTVGDIVVAALILLMAAGVTAAQAGYFASRAAGSGELTAVIEVDGKRVMEVPLSRDLTFTVDTLVGPEILEVKDGRIRVQESDCPDQICVYTGWISRPGQAIICLPGRMIVTVIGRGEDSRYDLVTQ